MEHENSKEVEKEEVITPVPAAEQVSEDVDLFTTQPKRKRGVLLYFHMTYFSLCIISKTIKGDCSL